MSQSYRQRLATSRRQRFTLIELIVVLIVLVALGTILVPKLPAMIGRSHVGSEASNIPALAKAVQQFELTNFRSPDNYDSLTEDGNAALFASLPGSGAGLTLHPLTAAEADSLTGAGIDTLKTLHSTADSATFDNYGVDAVVADTVNVAVLTTPADLGLDAAGTFAVFGIGAASEMVGQSLTQAPVHFPEDLEGSPASVYARYGVVYDISGESARFVMSVAFHEGGPSALEHAVEEFWEIVETDSSN